MTVTTSIEQLVQKATAHAAPVVSAGGKRDWYRIENKGSSSAEVLIFDFISWYGVNAQDFVHEINALDVDELTVRINSGGGSVFDGWAIYNALRSHKARVTTVVEGLAASAASYIAQAGDRRIVRQASQMMIHNASGSCFGQASDMREMADTLEKLSGTIADIYAARSGRPKDAWIEAMDAETWYTPQEAIDAGLADVIDDEAAEEPDAQNRALLTIFNYAGRENAPAPRIMASSPPAEDNRKEGIMPELKNGLRQRLGLAENVEDTDTILAAVDEALAERAEESTGAAAQLTAEELAAAASSQGMQVVDQATFEEVRRQASEGAALAKAVAIKEREQAVDSAINTGKIAASSREVWLAKLEADPTEASVLAGFPDNTIPVGEVGHNGDAVGSTNSTDDDLSWF